MPAPARAARRAAALAAAALMLSTTACGPFDSRVEVRPTGVKGAQRTACEELVAALPDRVADQPRVDTKGSPLGAAWGEDGLVLRCGVGAPASMGLTAQCQVADGLGWYVPAAGMNDQDTDVVMTTIERRPRVEVVVPARLRPPATAMIDLAPAVKAHTRRVSSCS